MLVNAKCELYFHLSRTFEEVVNGLCVFVANYIYNTVLRIRKQIMRFVRHLNCQRRFSMSSLLYGKFTKFLLIQGCCWIGLRVDTHRLSFRRKGVWALVYTFGETKIHGNFFIVLLNLWVEQLLELNTVDTSASQTGKPCKTLWRDLAKVISVLS
jgi:hypothetical protein